MPTTPRQSPSPQRCRNRQYGSPVPARASAALASVFCRPASRSPPSNCHSADYSAIHCIVFGLTGNPGYPRDGFLCS
jgi:hypothetical protein